MDHRSRKVNGSQQNRHIIVNLENESNGFQIGERAKLDLTLSPKDCITADSLGTNPE